MKFAAHIINLSRLFLSILLEPVLTIIRNVVCVGWWRRAAADTCNRDLSAILFSTHTHEPRSSQKRHNFFWSYSMSIYHKFTFTWHVQYSALELLKYGASLTTFTMWHKTGVTSSDRLRVCRCIQATKPCAHA